MTETKKGLKWWIFNKFGPEEVQNLIQYIDSFQEQYDTSEIVIYPYGQFSFNLKASNRQGTIPYMFDTYQERQAFHAGVTCGVQAMGGSTALLTEEDFDIIEQMTKSSTHGGGNNKKH